MIEMDLVNHYHPYEIMWNEDYIFNGTINLNNK